MPRQWSKVSWRYHAGLLEVFIYLVSVTWIFFVNLSEFSVNIGEFIINWNWFIINLVSYDDDFCDFKCCIFVHGEMLQRRSDEILVVSPMIWPGAKTILYRIRFSLRAKTFACSVPLSVRNHTEK